MARSKILLVTPARTRAANSTKARKRGTCTAPRRKTAVTMMEQSPPGAKAAAVAAVSEPPQFCPRQEPSPEPWPQPWPSHNRRRSDGKVLLSCSKGRRDSHGAAPRPCRGRLWRSGHREPEEHSIHHRSSNCKPEPRGELCIADSTHPREPKWPVPSPSMVASVSASGTPAPISESHGQSLAYSSMRPS